MKIITKRDLAVVQCMLAYDPNIAGMTIQRYASTDPVAPEYMTAFVSIPGLPGKIRVKVKEEMGNQWIPISLTTPATTSSGTNYEITKYYVLRDVGGMALRKR